MNTFEQCQSGFRGWQGQKRRSSWSQILRKSNLPVANETLAEVEEKLHYAPLSFPNLMMSKLQTHQKDLAKPPLGSKKHTFDSPTWRARRQACEWAAVSKGAASARYWQLDLSHPEYWVFSSIATETKQIGPEITEELGEKHDYLECTKRRLVNKYKWKFERKWKDSLSSVQKSDNQ